MFLKHCFYLSSEFWTSALTQKFQYSDRFLFLNRIKQNYRRTQISALFSWCVSGGWVSHSSVCAELQVLMTAVWTEAQEPLGFTSTVVRMMITTNIHQLMCWGTNMDLNLRSRSPRVCTDRNDFFFPGYTVTAAILWPQLCAGKTEASGLVPGTQAFLWHALASLDISLLVLLSFSDSFITSEGSDADTSIRAA